MDINDEITEQKKHGLVGWLTIATYFFDKSVTKLENEHNIKIIDPLLFRLAYTYFLTLDAIMSKKKVDISGVDGLLEDSPTFVNTYDNGTIYPLFIR
jgi:hypothetical protein